MGFGWFRGWSFFGVASYRCGFGSRHLPEGGSRWPEALAVPSLSRARAFAGFFRAQSPLLLSDELPRRAIISEEALSRLESAPRKRERRDGQARQAPKDWSIPFWRAPPPRRFTRRFTRRFAIRLARRIERKAARRLTRPCLPPKPIRYPFFLFSALFSAKLFSAKSFSLSASSPLPSTILASACFASLFRRQSFFSSLSPFFQI